MDSVIRQSFLLRNRYAFFILACMFTLGSLWYWAISVERGARVDLNDLVFAKVEEGIFEDVIPVRGQVAPLQTIYLDAIEGGRVEKIFVEAGETLAQGQLMVEFSNSRLQLDSITREAQVSEQINLLQTQELNLARNSLDHQRSLIDLEYRLKNSTRHLQRVEKLLAHQYISPEEVERLQNEHEFLERSLAITRESRAADEALRKAQLKQLRDSVISLNKNLDFSRRNLDSLRVTAPVAGRLTEFDLQVGQSLMPGERFGQIDDTEGVRVTAHLDEYYKNRVQISQVAALVQEDTHYSLKVRKIYPQVVDGRFRIDLVFSDDRPANISRGQGLQMKLHLGADTPAILIPNGAFVHDTGGHWVFVVESPGKAARRNIKLGRRNSHNLEVLAGLAPGDEIIISSYAQINSEKQIFFNN